MTVSDKVTFGGTGYDRAAELRPQADTIAKSDSTRAIVFWRGKPMLAEDALVRVPMDHPVLAEGALKIYLGKPDGIDTFAVDVSSWEPEDADLASIGAFIDQTAQWHPAVPADHQFREIRAIMTTLTDLDAELCATGKALISWHETHGFCSRCGERSVAINGGWQRDCPACGGNHFPRTDPVVIMVIENGDNVLLGRSPGWPEGMYSLLAGFVEPGETLEAAVRREVLEEAGVKVGKVGFIASQPWPFPASLMFGCHGQAESTTINVDTNELEDARWVSRQELRTIFDGEHPVIKPPRKGAIAQYLMANWLAAKAD